MGKNSRIYSHCAHASTESRIESGFLVLTFDDNGFAIFGKDFIVRFIVYNRRNCEKDENEEIINFTF